MNRIRMELHAIDRYLLDASPGKESVVATLLAAPVDDPRAAPFYRALRTIGARAADEAFVALRLVLAGRAPDDDAIRRLRGLAALARSPAGADAVFSRDGAALGDLAGLRDDPDALRSAARERYLREVGFPPAEGNAPQRS